MILIPSQLIGNQCRLTGSRSGALNDRIGGGYEAGEGIRRLRARIM